ncbi:MAG: hypothetical protein E4H13_08010 [Calditrichales bacterium]|nr:MAG: hypothetical protein E4H13_08010 [Calditrichales bacterium]
MLKDVSLTGLHITKQTKTISTVIGAMSVVNIGLNLLLILFWDSIGAALATLIAQVALFIIIYVMAQKSYPIPYEIGKVIKIIILGISLYLVSLLTIGMALYLRIVLKLLLVFLFPVILYYMNFYEKIELLRLKQSWHKWKNPLKWSENF